MALVTAPLGRRDNFPYRTLRHGEFRVVVVKKHAHWPRQNTLTCSIKHTALNLDSNDPALMPYTALSYTWGDGKDVTSLKLQDEETRKSGDITVTSSLIEALKTILNPGKHYVLWIDQICINQSNMEEKGRQVQLMRWIYERATVVRVWLGPAVENSDEAMLYLRDCDEASILRDLSDPNQTLFSPSLEEALRFLFRRPYWSRTWTVQEVTALDLQQVIISCGHESVPLTRIFEWPDAALSAVDRNSDRILQILGRDIVQMDCFWHLRRAPFQSLTGLAGQVRGLMASDPRDKVYSMLNFAADTRGSELTADYTKTVRQTFTEVVLWSIGKYKCLDVLGECSQVLDDDAAPSWVPNWAEMAFVGPFRKTSIPRDPNSSSLYQASGHHKHALGTQHPPDFNTRLLVLSGVKVANLDFVLNKGPPIHKSWTVIKTWAPTNGDSMCPLNMIPMHEVFRRTIHLDIHETAAESLTRGSLTRGNDSPLPWDTDSSAGDTEHIDSKLYVSGIVLRRCHFYTAPGKGSSHGLLGYSVITARPGDELWILKGGKMPFILRPKAVTIPTTDLETGKAFEHPVNAGMPTYGLVGEAFVLGLMDGEIIDMLGETPRRERPPPLADMDNDFRTIGLV
jgi:hypothetical protein